MFKVTVLCLFGLIILSVQGISLRGKKYNNSFTKCQDLQNPGTLEANVRYKDSDVRDEVYILLPEKGDFKRPISCIKVIDNSSYNASEVVIVQGGLNHQFAIFKIYIHSILADYDYTFQIYTRPSSDSITAAALCVFGFMICFVQGMSLQNNKYNSSYTLCKNLDDPGNLVANVSSKSQEDVNAIVRIPERSVFANSISCIKVIDNMENQDISEAAVNYGGLGKSMVEFKIYFLNTGYTGTDSGYDYTFLIYTKPLSTKLQSHRKHLA